MKDTDNLYQQFLISSIQEYIEYVRRYIESCKKYIYPTDDVQKFFETLEIVYQSFYDSLELSKSDIFPPGHPTYFGVMSKVLRINSALRELHPFLQYLESSREEIIRPELYHLINEYFKKIETNHVPFTIAVSPKTNFLYTDLVANLKDKIKVMEPGSEYKLPLESFSILQIPATEINNPLSWSSLIHEISHAIDEKENITARVSSLYSKLGSDVLDNFKSWLSETVADIITTRFLGPMHLKHSINSFKGSPNPKKGFETHPPDIFRIDIIKEELEAMKFSPESEEVEGKIFLNIWKEKLDFHETNPYQSSITDILKDHYLDEDKTKRLLDGLNIAKSDLQKYTRILLNHHFQRTNFDNSLKLVSRLSEGIPISAFSQDPPECEELPSEIPEILNAVWIYHETNEEIRDTREKLDNLIIKSIELANIHKQYLELKD